MDDGGAAAVEHPESDVQDVVFPEVAHGALGTHNVVPLPSFRVAAGHMIEALDAGQEKRVVVILKLFGSKRMHLYDGALQPIADTIDLFRTPVVYSTNQKRYPNGGLDGRVILDKTMTIWMTRQHWTRASFFLPEADFPFHHLSDQYSFAVVTADPQFQEAAGVGLC